MALSLQSILNNQMTFVYKMKVIRQRKTVQQYILFNGLPDLLFFLIFNPLKNISF